MKNETDKAPVARALQVAHHSLIVKAINEYEALNAVAEAAEEYYNTPRIERDGHKLEKTLASLASLRAGEPEKE